MLQSVSDDVGDNVEVFSSYINFCVDLILPVREVTTYPNIEPWIIKDTKRLIIERNALSPELQT